MRLADAVRLALRALRANLLRSGLTMLGIIIGTGSIITMVAIGSGAEQRIAGQIASLGANLLFVEPGKQRQGATRLGRGSHRLTEDDAAAIAAEVPSVEMVAPALVTDVQVVHGRRNVRTTLVGAVPEHFVIRNWTVVAGRAFTHAEQEDGAKLALLGTTVVERLFGGQDPLGARVRIGDVPFVVIGLLGEKGQGPFGRNQDDIVFVPLKTARLRLAAATHQVNPRSVDFINLRAASPAVLDQAAEEARALLRQRHWIRPGQPDDFQVRDLAALVAAQERSSRTFTLFLGSIASISLIVGGISIMNIMLVSVTERTREIGLRMAVGARRRDLLGQFLIEAVTLCLMGGLIGLAAGVATSRAVAWATGWDVVVAPGPVLLALGFAGLVGVVFGYWPARRAAALDPIDALRHE